MKKKDAELIFKLYDRFIVFPPDSKYARKIIKLPDDETCDIYIMDSYRHFDDNVCYETVIKMICESREVYVRY